MLEKAFEALNTYDWGADRNVLQPIDEAVIAVHGDAGKQTELEGKLNEALKSVKTRDARDYVCRKLMLIGGAASVPALSALLVETENSHMARFALERIPAPEAAKALREALPKVNGVQKIGVISSLGVRKDVESVAPIAALLGDSDAAIARAAAYALGDICTPDAAKALATAKPAAEAKVAVIDGSLSCADSLLKGGKKEEAKEIFKLFVGEDLPKHVRLAATRGMLACAGKTE